MENILTIFGGIFFNVLASFCLKYSHNYTVQNIKIADHRNKYFGGYRCFVLFLRVWFILQMSTRLGLIQSATHIYNWNYARSRFNWSYFLQ